MAPSPLRTFRALRSWSIRPTVASAIAAGRSCPRSAVMPITRLCAIAAPTWWGAHEARRPAAVLRDVRAERGGGSPGSAQQIRGVPVDERCGGRGPADLQPGEALQYRD